MQDSINERISIVAEIYSDKSSDFARATNLSNQNVYDLLTGRKGAPSFATIKKILIAFPLVSERWLLLGEGEMNKRISELNFASSPPEYTSANYPSEQPLDRLIDKSKLYSFLEVRMLLEAAYSQGFNDGKERTEHDKSSAGLYDKQVHEPDFLNKEASSTPVSATISYEQWVEFANVFVKNMAENEEKKDRVVSDSIVKQTQTTSLTDIYWIGKPDPSRPYNGLLTERLNITESEARELLLSGNLPSVNIGKSKRITNYRIGEPAIRRFLKGVSGDQQRADFK